MKKLLLLSPLSLQFLNSISWAEEKKKEDLYSQLNRTIVRLEHIETIGQEGSDKKITKSNPDGTGFFVAGEGKLFIVSARHVVEQPYDLHARVECINIISNQKEVILLKLKRNNWVFHPKRVDKDSHYVDVAAMRINWIKDRSIKHFNYHQEHSGNNDKNHLPENDPAPPRSILVLVSQWT